MIKTWSKDGVKYMEGTIDEIERKMFFYLANDEGYLIINKEKDQADWFYAKDFLDEKEIFEWPIAEVIKTHSYKEGWIFKKTIEVYTCKIHETRNQIETFWKNIVKQETTK